MIFKHIFPLTFFSGKVPFENARSPCYSVTSVLFFYVRYLYITLVSNRRLRCKTCLATNRNRSIELYGPFGECLATYLLAKEVFSHLDLIIFLRHKHRLGCFSLHLAMRNWFVMNSVSQLAKQDLHLKRRYISVKLKVKNWIKGPFITIIIF